MRVRFYFLAFCVLGISLVYANRDYYPTEQRQQCIAWLQSEQVEDQQLLSHFFNNFFESLEPSAITWNDHYFVGNALYRLFTDILQYSSCAADHILLFIEIWIQHQDRAQQLGANLSVALCTGFDLPPDYITISYEGLRYIPSLLEQVMCSKDDLAKKIILQLGDELIKTRCQQYHLKWIETLSSLLPYCDNEEDRALLIDYGAAADKANISRTIHALTHKKSAAISPLGVQEQVQRWNTVANNFTSEELLRMFGPYNLMNRSLAEKNWTVVRWCVQKYPATVSCKEFSKTAEGFKILAECGYIDFNGPVQDNMLWILWSSAVYYQDRCAIDLLKKREDTSWCISRFGAAFIVQAARKQDKELIQELQQLGASITEALYIVTKQSRCMRSEASRIFHTVWAHGWGSDELVYDPDQSPVRSMLSLLAECTSAEEFESVVRVEDMKKWWPDYAWKTRGRVSVFLEGIFGTLSN